MLIRPGDSTQLRAVVVSSMGDVRFTWSPADGLVCPTCAITMARPAETTQYTLLAENTTLGCQRMATVLVTISNCAFYAPDAFTPNQDGVNDVFFIPNNACIRLIHQLTIYDRWGEVIFSGQDKLAGDDVLG